jgi:hypothetical protein
MADALISDEEISILCGVLEGRSANFSKSKKSGVSAACPQFCPPRFAVHTPLRVVENEPVLATVLDGQFFNLSLYQLHFAPPA